MKTPPPNYPKARAFYEHLERTAPLEQSDGECDFVLTHLRNKTPFAFSRFNDGEMKGICRAPGTVVARGDQVVSARLKEALTLALSHRQHNYFVGIPCPFCFPGALYETAARLTEGYPHVVRAVAATNRNWAKVTLAMRDVCRGRRIRYISGDDQNLFFLESCMHLNIIDHVTLPRQNSWGHVEKVEPYLTDIEDGDVVMLSLGPTARVLAQRWFEQKPLCTFWDVGSNFDPFTRNVWCRCHLGWEKGFNIARKCGGCN